MFFVVDSSNEALTIRDLFGMNAGIAQLVERNLAKVEVEGSSPFSRSNLSLCCYSLDWQRKVNKVRARVSGALTLKLI